MLCTLLRGRNSETLRRSRGELWASTLSFTAVSTLRTIKGLSPFYSERPRVPEDVNAGLVGIQELKNWWSCIRTIRSCPTRWPIDWGRWWTRLSTETRPAWSTWVGNLWTVKQDQTGQETDSVEIETEVSSGIRPGWRVLFKPPIKKRTGGFSQCCCRQ